ncbi:MAG: hypothetical protein HY261_04540 [Chloroflexi bacterium]|nr:hypothetical protein [Chloroflexota bacterium]
MVGHVVADYFSSAYVNAYLNSTVQAVSEAGGGWFAYDQQGTYLSIEPPVIGDVPPQPSPYQHRTATEDELTRMVAAARARNLKFVLKVSAIYDGLLDPAKDPFGAANLDIAARAEATLDQWADRLAQGDAAARTYWDAWFEQYSAFVLKQAAIAQRLGIEVITMTSHERSADLEENAPRWRQLIARVRQVYGGKLTYIIPTYDASSGRNAFPWADLDYITFYPASRISDAAQPSIAEIKAAFERFSNEVVEPAARRWNRPVLFITTFMSRTPPYHEWFEWSQPHPEIGLDLLTQAKETEAFFQVMSNKPWVAGIFSWAFWWRDDFNSTVNPGDASYDKGGSIRNKPATAIWRRWAGQAF